MPSFNIFGGRPGSLLFVVGGPADPFPFRFSNADFISLKERGEFKIGQLSDIRYFNVV